MLHRLWKQAPGGRASAESINNKKRVVKMVLIVVILFALSWLPIQVILLLRSMHFYVNNTFTVTFQIISHILAYSNSCINPILYAFLSEPFRKGFWSVITCMRPGPPFHGGGVGAANGYAMGDVMPHGKKARAGRWAKKDAEAATRFTEAAGVAATNGGAKTETNGNTVAKTPIKVIVSSSGSAGMETRTLLSDGNGVDCGSVVSPASANPVTEHETIVTANEVEETRTELLNKSD